VAATRGQGLVKVAIRSEAVGLARLHRGRVVPGQEVGLEGLVHGLGVLPVTAAEAGLTRGPVVCRQLGAGAAPVRVVDHADAVGEPMLHPRPQRNGRWQSFCLALSDLMIRTEAAEGARSSAKLVHLLAIPHEAYHRVEQVELRAHADGRQGSEVGLWRHLVNHLVSAVSGN